ncbi:MAG: septum formation initiator family protein [Candidatus Omnitrophica bacterium]|nr:septum formation initiator family protein [Candidatus Omnitrophota bacterium]MDD5352924.1 septum formation initiator family protein [Candidatus Omnitrophota bacterium]MDD5550523.1 septum formation initiator family protein [Candidatus Omnitrophota bacterium]
MKNNKIFITIVVLGALSFISVFSKYQDLLQKNRELKFKMKKLAAENRALSEKQNKLETDPVFAESVARQELNVAKENEIIYKVIPEEK